MPTSDAELAHLLRGHVEHLATDSPHALAIFTEEDGEGGALYYLDGHFLAEPKGRDRAAYLLHEDWRLPSGHGEGGFVPDEETEAQPPAGDGQGATYGVFLVRESKYPLDDLFPAYRIDGVRLPGLARWALASPQRNSYFRLFPALLIAGVPSPTSSRTWRRCASTSPAPTSLTSLSGYSSTTCGPVLIRRWPTPSSAGAPAGTSSPRARRRKGESLEVGRPFR
jgi:hypothetical protein